MKIRGTETAKELPEKKRGRPPKNAVAMTTAERKAASRANQKQKEENAEREEIITALAKMYSLSDRRLLQELLDRYHEPTEKLRESLESTPVDTRGRLPGERQTKENILERLAAAKLRSGRRVRPRGAGPDS
jgi:AT-hook transcription factor